MLKKYISILLAFTAVFFTACDTYNGIFHDTHHIHEDVYHKEDYPQMYKETLDAMFGENYEISQGRSNSIEIECSEYRRYFTEWTLSYTDGNGNKQQFYFANRLPLSHWITQEISELAKEFYTPLYNKYFENIPLAQSSAMYFFVLKINCDPDDVPKITKTTDKYIENLSKAKNAVPFYKINETNLFELVPMEFSLHIFLDDQRLTASETESFRKEAEKNTDEFVAEFNKITENHACLSLIVGNSNSNDIKDTRKYYIKGDEIMSGSSTAFTFERDIFYALEEEFYS